MKTREELARQVIETLKLQRAYFSLGRDDPGKPGALERSKAAERQLRYDCQEILEGPTLFTHSEEHPR